MKRDPAELLAYREGRIARGVAAGIFDAWPAGERWLLVRGNQSVVYDCTTSAWRGGCRGAGKGWIGLLKSLGIRRRRPQPVTD